MAASLQRSMPIDIAVLDLPHKSPCEAQIQADSPDSNSSPNRTASTSSLHESASSGSLDAQSSASSSPTSGTRRQVAAAKPSKSCLSARDRPIRRKSVTFALESQSPSSDDLMTDYNIELSLQVPSEADNRQEDGVEAQSLILPTASKASLDKEQKHMEALSLKRYHAHQGAFPIDDSIQGERFQGSRDSSDRASPLPSHDFNDRERSNAAEQTSFDSSATSSTTFSIASPLSGLRVLGSHIDQGNHVLQSMLKRVAVPHEDSNNTERQTGWIWSTSVVVAAPVVFGLVMESLLG